MILIIDTCIATVVASIYGHVIKEVFLWSRQLLRGS